ncbi:glycine betaine ABC transporter permease [Planococcus sp. PAMC 21323]|uniref:BCCT family transporter n=1 Tax=Planococcus sp. PAMC 21323 TaxID=1526927 RepID=UPI000571C905|nr:BCCT family transporter [Planococcus sp. PAMC 21323]AIY06804.1 glycine betaine ABC transporter permease [Planococcus sp. PAMC 21323]
MKEVTRVFYITISLVIAAVLIAALMPEAYEQVTGNITSLLSTVFGWYYMLIMTLILIVVGFLIVSPYGNIRLGKPNDRPEFRTPTWVAMLFSAGLGIGLVFYGSYEPLSHFAISPATAEAGTQAAFQESMQRTFFHYGFNAWAMYGLVALVLAYFQFRKGERGLISSTLRPIFGDKMNSGWGTMIDVIAIFATVFGVATSLGFGAVQINGGLSFLFGISNNNWSQLIIIAIITVLFLASAWSGLSKGIKYLSNINMVLAVILLVLVVILGPTLLILNVFTQSFGEYIQNLMSISTKTAAFSNEDRQWLDAWTIFYWAWWISWAPFVSMFIARVSKGRTIREFLIYVVLLPTLLCAIWFSAFGVTAIDIQQSGAVDLTAGAVETILFMVFNEMPFGFGLSIIAILLLLTFFISSADSATFVLGMQSTNGSLTPVNSVKIVWGVLQSSIAAILLSVGGLAAIQNTIIIAALPFSFVVILMVWSLLKSLKAEEKLVVGKKK